MRSDSLSVPNSDAAIGAETTPSRTATTGVPSSMRTSMPAWKRSPPSPPLASPSVPAISCGPSSGSTGHSSGRIANCSKSKCGLMPGDGGRPPFDLRRRADQPHQRVARVGDDQPPWSRRSPGCRAAGSGLRVAGPSWKPGRDPAIVLAAPAVDNSTIGRRRRRRRSRRCRRWRRRPGDAGRRRSATRWW